MKDKTRRLVTGHDPSGRAIFVSDERYKTEMIPTGDAAMRTIWTTSTVPADCNDQTDGALRNAGTTLSGGSVLRIVDMLPGKSSPMHRSHSIDYGIVLSGEIVLELDNGARKTLGPHGIIIQNGTIHKWHNTSKTTVCRIVFILIEAKPFIVDGSPLPEFMEH